jgi:addiction module HigA family antidote
LTFITHVGILKIVLRSFQDKDTERVWKRQGLRKFDEKTQRTALRRLLILDAAEALGDLRVPPGNRLEKLRGDRADTYSKLTTTDEDLVSTTVVTPPIHPGEVLMHEYLEPLGITQHAVAVAIDVPPRRINEIVHGKRRITADTALRLAKYFGTTERFWLNLQGRYDIEIERDRLAPTLEGIRPLVCA